MRAEVRKLPWRPRPPGAEPPGARAVGGHGPPPPAPPSCPVPGGAAPCPRPPPPGGGLPGCVACVAPTPGVGTAAPEGRGHRVGFGVAMGTAGLSPSREGGGGARVHGGSANLSTGIGELPPLRSPIPCHCERSGVWRGRASGRSTPQCWGSRGLPPALCPFVREGASPLAAPSPPIEIVSPGGSSGPINCACVRRAEAQHNGEALGSPCRARASPHTPLLQPDPARSPALSPCHDIAGTSVGGRLLCPRPHPATTEGPPLPTPSPAAVCRDPRAAPAPPGGRGGGGASSVPAMPRRGCRSQTPTPAAHASLARLRASGSGHGQRGGGGCGRDVSQGLRSADIYC